MSNVRQLPSRGAVRESDTWDLSKLYASDDAWERDFNRWEKRVAEYARFQGSLSGGAEALAACLKFDRDFDRLGERLGTYAFLKTAEDATRDDYQRMYGRYINAASLAAQASSYIRPEILAIRAARLNELAGDKRLAPFRLWLERLVRYKPHTLSKKEERLLAMQTEMAQTAGQVFRKLNDADLKFGNVNNEEGQSIELTHASFTALLNSPKRSVRRTAFKKLYQQYEAHRHTLAAALEGSIQRDVYYARARNFPSALEASLFPDRVPAAVYDNLVASVHKRLPALYRYYDVRRRKMRLKQLHHYDTYVPILSELRQRHTWDEAVGAVLAALEPLGSEYCGTLERGLRGRWCDRYENRGKQSGAFSCGCYDGEPYILMNYQEDVLDHVFTLAHEAGHSMHSHFSAGSQPYQYYNYVIFVAEVASTFNEELLSRHLLAQAGDDQRRAYLVNRRIDAMRATIFRQTMFAEFEKRTHASAESGEPLTVDRFRSLYRELLELYFGPDFAIDDVLSLECFRIPHFYRAFYVYKYATGMSAAIALARRVAGGGKRQLDDYLGFLKAGCSKDPLDLLRDAGVDMLKPHAVDAALEEFEQLVDELDRLI
ncbi:MAG: oligoendopeptidase F [Thermoguttaceae bacterium]|jgi:oligoendopeptidase F